MSKTRKKPDAPSEDPLPDILEARIKGAFLCHLKFRATLRNETVYESVHVSEREDDMEAALIVELGEIWREWKGRSPRTVGTGASKLKAGQFPFGDWVITRFKAEVVRFKMEGEAPPSLYAIRKAIKADRY